MILMRPLRVLFTIGTVAANDNDDDKDGDDDDDDDNDNDDAINVLERAQVGRLARFR